MRRVDGRNLAMPSNDTAPRPRRRGMVRWVSFGGDRRAGSYNAATMGPARWFQETP